LWAAAEEKAGPGVCPQDGGADAAKASVDSWTTSVAVALVDDDPFTVCGCGNGVMDPGEECDPSDIVNSTCTALLGYGGGYSACSDACTIDPSACSDAVLIDNGDGTVTDNRTGLQWEKKTTAGGMHAVMNKYMWAGQCSLDTDALCQPDYTSVSACIAGAHQGKEGCGICNPVTQGNCSAAYTIWSWIYYLNNIERFAGHSDWRVPTVNRDGDPEEFESILLPSPCPGGICIESYFEPNDATASYWTATAPPYPGFGWLNAYNIMFSDPSYGVQLYGKWGGHPVRAVRTGP
jgi:hypothetical protein